MNKIILENDKLIDTLNNNEINIEYLQNELIGINYLKIELLQDTNLQINYNLEKLMKLEVEIIVNDNVKAQIFEKITGTNTKIRTKYKLNENTKLTTTKFNDIETIKEYAIIYLEGKNSNIKYNLKTISKNKEKYDILIYHNNKETNSEIITNGVNINEGTLKINVSSFVPKNNKNCIVSQNNRIINLTNNICTIKPNLYIDEYDVTANHSALIKTFDENELFYLQSRGLKKEDSINLMIKGFLLNKLDIIEEEKDKINLIINKYWR